MSKVCVTCDWCGAEFRKDSWTVHEHNFCCFDHFRFFASKRMSNMNRELNPTRMTPETREKVRKARLNSGEGRTYSKEYGRHTHRVEMERILGRKLLPGEVVHHIDGDKRNNDPDNLMVFSSQAEHASYHMKMDYFFGIRGGDQ